MAIEIRELIIRATVTETAPKQESAIDRRELERLRQEIIRECLSTIMDRMDKRIDR